MNDAWLGRMAYESMWRTLVQQAAVVAEGGDEVLWSCEHDPVYTTGRRGVDNRLLETLPAPFVRTDRGGETTFHGPGQLLLYPVIHLRRRTLGVKAYVYLLEQSCINLLQSLGVEAHRRKGFPGVWTVRGKIAALGVRVRRGVAYHGMALNVTVDRRWFAAINPCGTGLAVDRLMACGLSPALPELAQDWHSMFSRLLSERC